MRRWLADRLLASLQRGCNHPGRMVAADVLQGEIDGLNVRWCRRCGAIAIYRGPGPEALRYDWQLPDPNLWMGR